jgi:hypothetical protein
VSNESFIVQGTKKATVKTGGGFSIERIQKNFTNCTNKMDCKEFCLLQWLIPMVNENRTLEMDYIEFPIGIMIS